MNKSKTGILLLLSGILLLPVCSNQASADDQAKTGTKVELVISRWAGPHADDQAAVASVGSQKALDVIFQKEAMPTFQHVSMNSEIWAEDFSDTTAGKTLFAAVLVPGGSTMAMSENGQEARRMNSLRGVLIFFHGDYLYEVMNDETTDFPGLRDLPRAELVKRLREELLSDLAGMTFR